MNKRKVMIVVKISAIICPKRMCSSPKKTINSKETALITYPSDHVIKHFTYSLIQFPFVLNTIVFCKVKEITEEKNHEANKLS